VKLARTRHSETAAADANPGLAAMRHYNHLQMAEPACGATGQWIYPFHLDPSSVYFASNAASAQVPLVIWDARGGLGNSLLGFATAFEVALLRGSPLLIGEVGELCSFFRCGFPVISETQLAVSRSFKKMNAFGLPSAFNNCSLAVTGCLDGLNTTEQKSCFAGRAIQLLLSHGFTDLAVSKLPELLRMLNSPHGLAGDVMEMARRRSTSALLAGWRGVHLRTGDQVVSITCQRGSAEGRRHPDDISDADLRSQFAHAPHGVKDICLNSGAAGPSANERVFLASDSNVAKRAIALAHPGLVTFFNSSATHFVFSSRSGDTVCGRGDKSGAELALLEAQLGSSCASSAIFLTYVDLFVLSRVAGGVTACHAPPASTYAWSASLLGGRPLRGCARAASGLFEYTSLHAGPGDVRAGSGPPIEETLAHAEAGRDEGPWQR